MDRANSIRIDTIDFDCNSTTPISPRVLIAMEKAPQGNSHSLHKAGLEAKLAIKNAESVILKAINGHKGHIVWTGSGSEANKIAIRSRCKGAGDLLTTMIEHKSIESLRREYGHGLEVNSYGLVKIEDLKRYINRWIKLVSIIYVNNETGTIQPIKKIKEVVGNICLHIDAVQALGKIPIDVEDLGCDMISLSAHKINGPKGIGCLWIRNGINANIPYMGTLNTAGIIGFATAVEELSLRTSQEQQEIDFINELDTYEIDYEINVPIDKRTPGTLSLYFPGVDAELLMLQLSDLNVMISIGSACNMENNDLSHVLIAMGYSEKRIRSTVRVSLGHLQTIDIVNGVGLIAQAIKEIKNGS